MAANALPSAAFECLIPSLLQIHTVVHTTNLPPAVKKQALLHATAQFKERMAHAKELANTLPGGDLTAQDQDKVIQILESLRDQKCAQIVQFSNNDIPLAKVS